MATVNSRLEGGVQKVGYFTGLVSKRTLQDKASYDRTPRYTLEAKSNKNLTASMRAPNTGCTVEVPSQVSPGGQSMHSSSLESSVRGPIQRFSTLF